MRFALQFAEMKLLVELHKEFTAETTSIGKSKNVPEGQNQDGQKPQEQPKDLKPTTEQPQTDRVFSKPSEKQRAEDGRSQGIHIVGGSAFGWNFVTYSSAKEPAYYGETKETFRLRNPIK